MLEDHAPLVLVLPSHGLLGTIVMIYCIHELLTLDIFVILIIVSHIVSIDPLENTFS